MPKLPIKSPKATQVKGVLSPNGTKVAQDETLLELYDYEEQKILSSIRAALAENEAKAAELAGPRVAKKLAGLAQITNDRKDAISGAQMAYEEILGEFRTGSKTTLDLIRAHTDVSLKVYQALKSAVEHDLYARNTEDGHHVFEAVSKLLNKELQYVQRSAARLRIAAPRPGKFKCYVDAGTPVRIGHLLGEIEYS
jgi:hypothetical protein